MDPEVLQAVIEAAVASKPRFVLDDFLFKEQLALVRDPANFSTAVCSVRAGKTTACAADLIDTSLRLPGTTQLYITLARSSGKRIVWPELLRINEAFQLNGDPNIADLSLKFPNGSVIYCLGANTEVEMDKIRGMSDVALVYVDESQLFRSHIQELVDDVIVKRLYDRNGRCRLIGTPGPIPSGYFHDASLSPEWSHHHWTLHSNPHIERKSGKTVVQLIAQDCARKGVGLDDPSIQRECFGRWVLDSNSLLLEYNAERNHYDVLPKGNYVYILGMDFGYEDADAFSVLGWREGSPDTYLVEELIAAKQTYEQMVANFEMLHKKYPLSKVVADPGGGGKKLIESLRPRYAIPMQPADKLGKIANYGLLNNALRTGRFFARRDSRFAQECNLLERDKDKSTPERIVVKGHSDSVDSVLYPFRESPAYGYTPPPPVLKPGTPEWSQDQEDKMREHLYKTIKTEQDEMKEWDGYGQYY